MNKIINIISASNKLNGSRAACLILLSIILFVTACPYSSTVPISSPTVKINKLLLGNWKKQYGKNYVAVTKKSPTEYKIVQKTFNSSKKTYSSKKYIGHLSIVNGKPFMNLKASNGKYFFYKINSLTKSRLVMKELTDNITEGFSSSAALKAFVEKNMHLSFFYNKSPQKYKRKKFKRKKK